jgi:hypothetical protein
MRKSNLDFGKELLYLEFYSRAVLEWSRAMSNTSLEYVAKTSKFSK